VKTPKTFEGRWWIFGNDKPEHFGVLHYSPEDGLRLEVKVAQSFSISEILGRTTRTEFADAVQGRDENDSPISLFCCASPSINRSCGLASYELYPLVAIVGQTIESWNAAKFQKIDLRFSLLHNWMAQSRINQNFTTENVLQIQIQPKAAIEVKLPNGVVLKINSIAQTHQQPGSLEIHEEHYVSLEFPQPIHAKSILVDYAERLRRLFSILTGTEVVLDSVLFEVPESGEHPAISELLQRNEAAVRVKRDLNVSRMTAPYRELSEALPVVIAKWFEYHQRLDAVLNLYFAVLFNRSLYINHRFLFLAQALEVYHNTHDEFVGYVQQKNEFRERTNQIVKTAPLNEQAWLREKLHYANQKTLAERLSDILSKNKTEAEQFISDLSLFADAVRNTRNYHTHFDEELREKGKVTENMDDLVRLVSQMETLLGVCIMKDIGIVGAPIARLIDRYRRMEIFSLK
jgi:hypothetical protein